VLKKLACLSKACRSVGEKVSVGSTSSALVGLSGFRLVSVRMCEAV
jgi:hypothetical protein